LTRYSTNPLKHSLRIFLLAYCSSHLSPREAQSHLQIPGQDQAHRMYYTLLIEWKETTEQPPFAVMSFHPSTDITGETKSLKD
jgi:hypothetical protein